MKTCPSCQISCPAKDFYRNSSRKDGLASYCKDCFEAKRKKHTARNIEKVRLNPPTGKKQCSRCLNKKSLEEFVKNRNNFDGLACECKSCMKEYKQRHTKEIAAYQKEYRESHRKA
jgi:hypothetical protein